MDVNSPDFMAKWWNQDMRLGASHGVQGLQFSGSLPHCHTQYAFIICLKGSNEFVCDGIRYVQNPGELVVHNSGQVHQSLYAPHQYSETVTLYVDPIFLLRLAGGRGVTLPASGQTLMFLGKHSIVRVIDLAEELIYELDHEKLGREMLLHSLSVHILIRLLREILPPTMVRAPLKKSPRLHTQEFSNVTGYMENRSFSSFSLVEVCHILGTSESRFVRLFKNCTGQTPNAYFTQFLMKKAQMFLRTSRCTVKEAALELGFRDVSYFCRVFRSVTGTSPNTYKETTQDPASLTDSNRLGVRLIGSPHLSHP